MTQATTPHACIAIGIDRYRYMQPLRYALEDARDFHATIAALNWQAAHPASRNADPLDELPAAIGLESGWGASDPHAGYENGNGHAGKPLSSLATLEGRSALEAIGMGADESAAEVDPACLLLTEASPPHGKRSTYPTRDNILHAIYRWTREAVTPDRLLWCFFSGYGLEIDGTDYLLPIDASPDRWSESAIDIGTIFDALVAAPSDRAILVLDINRPTGGDLDSDIGLHTAQLAKAHNIPTLLSCQPHERSRETRDLRHGVFSAALLEALRHGKCPTLESLSRYLQDRVPELCELYWQPTQTPTIAIGPDVPSPFALGGAGDTVRSLPDSGEGEASLAPETRPDPAIDTGTNAEAEGSAEPGARDEPDSPDSQETTRSSVGLLSSVGVWLALFGSVLGLGVWMNDSALDPSDPSNPSDPADAPVAPIAPADEAPAIPNASDVAIEPDDGTDTAADTAIIDATNEPTGDPALDPALDPTLDPIASENAPPTAPNSPQTTQTTQTSTGSPTASETVELTDVPPEILGDNPPEFNARDPERPSTTIAPNATFDGESSSAADRATSSPVMEPTTIASLHSLAASPLDMAIARARALQPGDPGYDRRDRDIERWGTTIFEIAQSRADRGQWMLASAAARLVPPELDRLQRRAERSIDWWTQAQVNGQIVKAARQSIEPNQVSSYWRAIERLRSIQNGQPFYEEARAQIDTWATDMLATARQRAERGQLDAAIAAVRLVPRGTPAYTDARSDLERWQKAVR